MLLHFGYEESRKFTPLNFHRVLIIDPCSLTGKLLVSFIFLESNSMTNNAARLIVLHKK